ncbi:O-methyltransferase [Pseudonocardia sp. Ae707_Ps1]|nr:O-methyltransferase [Pseudonocardia sp. Ae707_Ps1]
MSAEGVLRVPRNATRGDSPPGGGDRGGGDWDGSDRDGEEWPGGYRLAAVDPKVHRVLDRLLADAAAHDAAEPDRLRRWRVLEPDAGALLGFLVRLTRAREAVEIGTSQGASTLVLAEALAGTGGHLTSVDTGLQAGARDRIDEAGLTGRVTFLRGDGGGLLAGWPDGSLDLLFLDAERTEYASWWPHPTRVLHPGGLLAVDNALSHAAEVAPLAERLDAEPGVHTVTVPVGKGVLLAFRS